MALEAAVFHKDLLAFNMKELYSMGCGEELWSYDFAAAAAGERLQETEFVKRAQEEGEEEEEAIHGLLRGNWETASVAAAAASCCSSVGYGAAAVAGQRKRRRVRKLKNKEDVESQRMTHIVVERNRRKQMKEYLAMLRSLMPSSFVQRVDQASIVGGAINFVKELEQLAQSLEALKRIKRRPKASPLAFDGFFAHPQYSSTSSAGCTAGTSGAASSQSAVAGADIEVGVVEGHANIKIFSRWRPRQLLELVVGLQSLHLTTLHLNVTTVDRMVLYCFNLKVEDGCQFTSVDAIAAAVRRIIARIEEEAALII